MSQYDILSITEELVNETKLPLLNFKEEAYENVCYSDRIVTHKIDEENGTVTIVYVDQGNAIEESEIVPGEERYNIVKVFIYMYSFTDNGPFIWKSREVAENLEAEEVMHYLLNDSGQI
jgi:hypothetical protein